MESFITFVDIFVRCVEENNSNDLTDLLKNGRKYFQGLTTNDSKQALSKLFNTDKGLLVFFKNELCRTEARRSFDNVIKEGFLFIEFVVENFHMAFHQYILPVKITCQLALIMHCSMYIKKAACSTMTKLIEKFKENELDLDETVVEFVSKFYQLCINERSYLFSILGTIAQYHPQVPKLQRHKKDIFIQLFNDFKKQYRPTAKNQPNEIQIYVEVLINILDNLYAPNEIESRYYTQIYNWIKHLSIPDENQTKKNVMRTAITLLSRRMNLFCELVYNDYEYWYKLFSNLTKEKGMNGQCGQQALKAYYNNLQIMLRRNDSEKDKTVFLYFKNLLREQLTNTELDPDSLRLVIHGFSKLAAPCKKYLNNNDVKDMYLLIARCTTPLCLSEDMEQIKFENISDYQEALSEILCHISDVSIGQIKLLIKVSVLSIKRYPNFSHIRKTYAVSSLIKAIINVASINKILLDEFLYNIIHDGIAWTCSHTLLIDAELQRELNNLPQRPICYKNYLPMWLELVKPSRYQLNGHILIAQQIFDKMIHVYIMLITKLNLNTKMKEDCVLSDAALSQTAENEADFRIFVNMVDLMVDIMDGVESFLLNNTIPKFCYEMIRMSYRYPLISGFYKLIHAVLKNSEIFTSLDNDDNNKETQELVYKYLTNTLDQITTFSNELLTACLYLIMCMPTGYLSSVLNRTIPTFKIAITIGLNDLDLMSVVLDTLEKWMSYLNPKDKKDFLVEVVPNLELFLQSKESSTELLQDILKYERKTIKHVTLIDNDNTLESIQKRILLFLGSLDSDVLLTIVYKRALNTESTWDKKDLLNCTLPFPDLRIELHFDKILPRLITLAENSGDRRTKVIASELLHAMVSFILGKTVQNITVDIDRFATLYRTLYPALINLSCDSDEVVWKLFQPLTIQLSHWLSSQLMFKSNTTALFISSLFDGLCNDEKSSLREFAGLCLAEFTEWSLNKLSETKELNIHVHGIIRKITNFALHPSKCKRIAAATAFNHLYRIMREHEDIITIYWLELLYCFVKSLDGCNDLSIHNALSHIDKVIRIKAYLLNEDHPNRRKPSAFIGKTLTDAVNWLFVQCGSLDQNCRHKSMELYIKMSEYLDMHDSPETFLEYYIETNGINAINCVILKDLQSKGKGISCQSMLLLLRSLDCYMWLINKRIIKADYLFTDINSEKDIIFDCIRNFIHSLFEVKVQTENTIIISREFEELQTLQCKTIMTILDFIQTLLNLRSDIIPDFFLNEELFDLIAKCIICPRVLGFDMKNVTINEKLPLLLKQLLQVLLQTMNDSLQHTFTTKIETYVLKYCTDFLIVNGSNDSISTVLKEYVKGLIVIENCNILCEMCKDHKTFEDAEIHVEYIFRSLIKKEEEEQIVCVSFHTQTVEYLQHVMELFLARPKPSMTKTLIHLIGNNTKLLGLDSTEITHGEYFLNMFKDIIFAYILKDIDGAIIILEELLQTNASFTLTILEELLLFSQNHKNKFKDYVDSLVTTIIKKFITLDRATNNIESRKEKLINIYGISVHLMLNPIDVVHISEDFYQWILKEFTMEKADIEYKTKLLQNFLVCLTDASSQHKPELVAILRTLRNDRLSLSSNICSEHSVDGMKIINCFYTLLTLLPKTKSLIVFETIIFFAAGGGKYLFSEKLEEFMKKYFNAIPSNYALKSLEIAYKLFMDTSNFGSNTSCRFDVLEKFLIPIFQFCNTTEIEQFYVRNIKEIYTTITKDLIGDDMDKQQLIISKIACYELVAIMFVKIDEVNIINVNSMITRNAIANVNTGKELFSELYASSIRIRSLKTDNPEHKEIMRLLQCSAYNCSIAIVSLKNEEQPYLSVFGENKNKNMLIWQNIIDCDKKHNIQQTVVNQSKNRKKLVNIRKKVNQQYNSANKNNYSYIYSYNISESTIHEDLNAYDFNEAHIISKSGNNNMEENMSLEFESDDLNNHECMPSICGVLRHMISKEIYNISNKDNVVLPKSLKCFHDSMLTQNNNNVKLFMLKVLLNTSQLFEHYAKFFLYPVMTIINSYLDTNNLNYVIADALLMLIDWHTVAIPTATHEKALAQKLFEKLIRKILMSDNESSTKVIYKYNVNIIRMLVQVWQPCLQVPKNLNEIMIKAPNAAVHLILMCLVSNMQAEIIVRDDISEFLQTTVEKWQEDEEMILQSCEALGVILKSFKDDPNYSTRKSEISVKLLSIFRQMQKQFENRQIKCIQALCKNYPEVAIEYIEFITINASRVDAAGKAICLELFSLIIPQLTKEQIIKELSYIKFHDILKNRIVLCEKIALKIIHALISVLEPMDLLSFAKLVPPYAKHDFSEYREIAYKIFMDIYNKYAKVILNDGNVEELICISKQILIGGLLDPAADLQTKVLHFWTEDVNLTNKTLDRLLDILKIYTPNTEDVFLPFIPLTMLNLVTKTAEYTNKMFGPLTNSDYKTYEIQTSWKIKNLGSIAPLFAPSLASQMNQVFTQTIASVQSANFDSFDTFSQSSNINAQFRSTMELEFEPTYLDEDHSDTLFKDNTEWDNNLETLTILQPAYSKRSRRFLASSTAVSNIIKHKEMQKNVQRREMIKEETIRQRSSVNLCRKYRYGEFPDIEITLSDFTKPLQDLIKKDMLICKDVTVIMFSSLMKDIRNQNDENSSSNNIISILKEMLCNCQGNSPLITAILEIMFTCHIVDCSPDITAKVFKANNFNSIAIQTLLLEENLIYYSDEVPPPQKKMHLIENEMNDQTHKWILLADLYKSINEVDIVLSIFRDKIDNENLQSSSFAQFTSNWTRGKLAYENAYIEETGLIKEHCLQGLFECLSYLSEWDEIDKHIKNKLDQNIGNIWSDAWKNWMFPWMFNVYTHELLAFDDSTEFEESLKTIESWLEDETKLNYIKHNFGEELALFFVSDKKVDARELLYANLDELREQWIQLHPLSVELRKKKLQKLRGISDINLFLRCLKTSDDVQGIQDLIRLWSNSTPLMQDDLLLWDKLVLYRSYFEPQYVETLKKISGPDTQNDELDNYIDELSTACCQLSLDMINISLYHKNKFIANKHFCRLKEKINGCSSQIKHKYIFTAANLKYLKGEDESGIDKKISYYASSWKYSHKILNEEDLDMSVNITARQHISMLATRLASLSCENAQFADILLRNNTILKDLNPESNSIDDVTNLLECYSFNKLKECCSIGNTKDSYFSLSKYCYEQLCKSDSVAFFKEFVHSTLKAMSYGSIEATHYFPCLLKHEYLENDEIKDIFIKNSNEVQSWLFLRWQAQLFSHLGTSITNLIVPIIEKMIEDYPNALIYTLRLTVETNSHVLNDPRIYKIRKFLYDKQELEQFLEAMQYVVQPESYLQYYLRECVKNLSKGTATAVDIFLTKIYSLFKKNRNEPRPGNIYSMFKDNRLNLKQLEKIKLKDEKEIRQYLKSLDKTLKQSLEKRKPSGLLKDYSPWLCEFSESNLEVPGQYTGYMKPMPQYHAKIMKIDPIIKVMESLRKPVRITIIGNDAKDYMFLNKFGEDLRLDQRIQQIFSIVNKTLDNDVACRQRHLFIDTYQVIPLSISLGLIQWIEDTKPLQDLIYFILLKNQYPQYNAITAEYSTWIQKAGPPTNIAAQYKEATLKYDAVAVTTKMNELIAKTEWDLLRKACMILCPSPESFITFRRNFITSYATMCAVHWILGIGDRHLQNILIIIGSGKCLGVDFDQAFDAGIDSVVPQLMPFRLTSQILGLLKPFTEKDLFAATMIHVLKALRSDQNRILACLEVFIHEPLNWTEYVNKPLQDTEDEETDVKWLPQKKIGVVAKKLRGINPSVITLEQLKGQHSEQYFERYSAIVTGNDNIKHIRATVRNDKLTAEEQVQCLLDQATDLNILGRTYVGWRPWL